MARLLIFTLAIILPTAKPKIVTEYVSGANCGLSKAISVLEREPTAAERTAGCIFVQKHVPEATAAGNF